MTSDHRSEPAAEQWIEVVRRKVAAMRFGSVQIVIHEGRVTLVESTERTRISDVISAKDDDTSKGK